MSTYGISYSAQGCLQLNCKHWSRLLIINYNNRTPPSMSTSLSSFRPCLPWPATYLWGEVAVEACSSNDEPAENEGYPQQSEQTPACGALAALPGTRQLGILRGGNGSSARISAQADRRIDTRSAPTGDARI